jgi:AcrR family transcriptional regulator
MEKAARPRRPAARKAPAARASAPARRTQTERREEAERRLLDAALAIVAQTGTVRLTLAAVGEAAGYSRGLPAHRFGSKSGLLRALVAHIHGRFRDQLQAAPARQPGLDAIRGNISVYFGRTDRAWTTTRALLVMMTEGFMEGAGLKKDMAAYNRAALKFFETHIRSGIAAGELRADADPATDAVLILGALRGVMLQWLLDDGISLARLRDRLLAIVERALAAR